MDITDIRERRIIITFHNQAPVPCAISDIYFVDGDIFTISVQNVRHTEAAGSGACIIDIDTGCQQSVPAPYHDSSTYQVARHHSDELDTLQDGIRQKESLGIVFDLQAGVTQADVISALSMGQLNISLKLQAEPQAAGGILVNDSRLGLRSR
jgi:hypothetical protein